MVWLHLHIANLAQFMRVNTLRECTHVVHVNSFTYLFLQLHFNFRQDNEK